MIELLDAERGMLLARVSSVPDALREQRPGEGRWSVAEVLEHLATVEKGVARLLMSRLRDDSSAGAIPDVDVDVDVDNAARLGAARIARLRDRTERVEAPDRVKPRGAMHTPDALRALGESRAALKDAVFQADAALLDRATHAHPVLGTLTLRGWVQLVGHHEARHSEQIGEIARAFAASSAGNGAA